jgi:hypothetical protein
VLAVQNERLEKYNEALKGELGVLRKESRKMEAEKYALEEEGRRMADRLAHLEGLFNRQSETPLQVLLAEVDRLQAEASQSPD